MNQQEALKRLEQIEAQARAVEFEQARHDPEFRAKAAAYAARFDLDVDELIEGTLEIVQRIAEIGQDAYDQETAEQYGMTVEAWRARDHEAEWKKFKEWDRARRAEIVHWRQGVAYKGGVPVTD